MSNVFGGGVATAVWGIWTAIELGFRRHPPIPSRDRDKGSLSALKVAHACRLLGMLVGFLGAGTIARGKADLQFCGLALMVVGIAVRWTAIHELGVLFTGRVQIRDGHTLVRRGLYSRLRHPAYAGSVLAYLGLGLAFSNWWTLGMSVLPYLLAISYRIHVEEEVLQETFGAAYAQYAQTTQRIIPWVY